MSANEEKRMIYEARLKQERDSMMHLRQARQDVLALFKQGLSIEEVEKRLETI